MVIICTPTRDLIHAGTAFDLVNLIKSRPDTFFAISQGTYLAKQRTELVEQSINAGASHILFIDSDMRFPEDTLERLLEHDLDIVGVNYRHRQSDKWVTGISSDMKFGLQEVKRLGFGVTLIKTSVFEKLPIPYFNTEYDGDEFIGEDVNFCINAIDAGFKIFVDHDLSQEVKHLGVKEI